MAAGDEWKDQSSLRAISKNTPTRMSIATLVTVAIGLVGFGWAAKEKFGNVEHEVRSLGSVVGDLPRKQDLRELELRISSTLRKQMRNAMLKCPRRAGRGDAWMDCQVIFPEE
jgi:hypothetical protein